MANGHDAVHRQVRWTAVGWLPPPGLAHPNQRGRVSNPDIPAPYRPGRGGSVPAPPGLSGRLTAAVPGVRPVAGGTAGTRTGHRGGPSGVADRRGAAVRPRPTAPAAGSARTTTRRGGAAHLTRTGPGGRGAGTAARAPGVSAAPAAARRPGSAPASATSGTTCVSGCAATACSGDWDDQGARPSRRRDGNGGGDWGGPDDPGGKAPRRKGSWWRHWTWKKALTIVAGVVGLFIIMITVGVAYAYSKTPIPDVQSAVMQQASKVYFSDGKTEVGQFGQTNRVILTYSQFPAVLRDAVVAAEDKNFWHEGGISPTGILRAAYYDLTSSGGNLQGGFHHHPAAGQELLRRHRHVADREPQDQGDLRLAEARPGQVQGVDPPAVPEHGLLRRWRLRCRRGGAGLLRPGPQPAQQDHAGAGRDDRRDDPEPELLQARPERRSGPRGPGGPLEVRAPGHGDHGHAVPAGLLGGGCRSSLSWFRR